MIIAVWIKHDHRSRFIVLQSFFPLKFRNFWLFFFFLIFPISYSVVCFCYIGNFCRAESGRKGWKLPRDPGKMYSKVSSYVWSWSTNWGIWTQWSPSQSWIPTQTVYSNREVGICELTTQIHKRVCVLMKIMRSCAPLSLCSLNLLWALGH